IRGSDTISCQNGRKRACRGYGISIQLMACQTPRRRRKKGDSCASTIRPTRRRACGLQLCQPKTFCEELCLGQATGRDEGGYLSSGTPSRHRKELFEVT